MLVEAGVEYYHVDYVGKTKSFYNSEGEKIALPIPFNDLPSVGAELDVIELKSAILDSQQNGQKFHDFSIRATKAGVQGYYAFLRGKRVTYLGRAGDSHTEWFPDAKP